jgi:hypothetical protein
MIEKISVVELTEGQTAMVAGGASIHIDFATGEFKASNDNSFDNGMVNVFLNGDKVSHEKLP